MKKSKFITHSALIAALYVALTLLSNLFGLSSGAVQIRFSEALTILPIFTPSSISGLFIGCIIANLLTGSLLLDVIFGSLATLIGAYFTYLLRKKPILATLPPIISNTIIIPFILRYVYAIPASLPYFMLTIGVGEVISCGVLGTLLRYCLEKHRRIF